MTDDLTPKALFQPLALNIFRLSFKSVSGGSGSDGSAWRGALGPALRDIVCAKSRDADCDSCKDREPCVFYLLYKFKSAEPGFLYPTPPRPYIIRGLRAANNAALVELTLVGNAADHASTIIKALLNAGCSGIGTPKIRFDFNGLERMLPDGKWAGCLKPGDISGAYPLSSYMNGADPPTVPWMATIVTPLRHDKGGPRSGDPDWASIWKNFGLHRCVALHRIYCGGGRLPVELWGELTDLLSKPGQIRALLEPEDRQRHSGTQRRSIPRGGLVGAIAILPPQGLEHVWWQWWRAAELLHLGKGVSEGLGKIRIIA